MNLQHFPAGRWVPLYGQEGGTVTSLALSPEFATDRVAFAATHAGLFVSRDGGDSWAPIEKTLTSPFIEAIGISPTFRIDHTLFLGSREGLLFRSTDGGSTFTCLGWLGERSPVVALGISPGYGEDSTVLAGTFEDGVYRSEDRGTTWATSNFGLLDLSVLAMALSPDFARDETAFLATGSGLYRSRNGGRSWREVDLGIEEAAVQALAISPTFATDRTVFVGTEERGVYRSTDGGTSWHLASTGLPDLCINALAVSPHFDQDRIVVAATSAGLCRSQDGGETWQPAEGETGGVLCLAAGLMADGIRWLAGRHQEGMLRSEDGGKTWAASSEELVAGSMLGMVASPDPAAPATLFAWGVDEGVLRSDNGGLNWAPADAGLGFTEVSAIAMSPGYGSDATVYAATLTGLYASTDGGASWTPTTLTNYPVSLLALSPAFAQDRSLLVLAGGRLLLSPDGGQTWHRLESPGRGHEVLGLAFSPDYAGDHAVYLATRTTSRVDEAGEARAWRGVVRGQVPGGTAEGDIGVRWQALFSQREVTGLVALGMPPTIRRDGAFFIGTAGQVYRQIPGSKETSAEGERPIWMGKTLGRAGAAVVSLAVSPDFARDRTVYAATSAGVYRSRDGGASWHIASEGLARLSVISIAISPSYATDRRVYALTLGGQVWTMADSA